MECDININENKISNNNINSNFENLNSKNNLQEFINKIKLIKTPENPNKDQDNMKLYPFLKTDKKMRLLLGRTYYMKEFDKIERYINAEGFLVKNYNLTNDQYIKLISFFNNLLNLQNICVNNQDYAKCLQIQNKIINILKKYIINKIG